MLENILSSLFGNRHGNNRFRNRGAPRFSYKLVPFEQAKNMIEQNQVTLIDVRTPSEYELMHVKNAINIPVDESNSYSINSPH